MAEPGRTVRASGLPTDIEEERLKDKLCIYFLRSKNGGGEIESVTIDKATPVSALITFEDSRVAQRLIQDSCHILKIDGKTYEVTVTEHRESIDPDKVIVNLSATVNYRQLPGGVMALASLRKSHPEIELLYSATEELCTLRGAYSKVQAAFTQLFGHPVGPESAKNKDSGQSATSGSRSAHIAQKTHPQGSEDQNGKPKQKRQREKARISRPTDEYNASTYRDQTPGGWEDTGQTAGAALQPPGHPSTLEEDFLIVDADMFQYLQKHCLKEYQRILRQYGVEVVDVTNQGLTTLFLKVAASVGDDGQGQECLKLAKKEISRLYEENETKICRSQLPKSILSPRGELQRAIENLSVRFPKLLLNEDNQNIYFIGSNSDVSEAKMSLLNPYDVKGKKEDVASLLRYPSYDSSPSTQQQRGPLTTSSTVDYVDEKADQLLRSEEDQRRAEGARKYKLAARFKDSGLPALGSRPTDFTLRGGLSSSSRQTRLRPMLGHDVLSDTAETAGERVSRAASQNTGGDILFQSGDSLPSPASLQNKTSLNPHLFDTRPKSSPLSTTQSNLSERSPFPPAGSGSTLRRTSSFSGTPQEKPQVTGQRSQDDSTKSTSRARARSSSFSSQTGRDKREVYTAEIKVFSVLWQHIKEAYRIRLDDLTSDVQLHENRSEGSDHMTVTIRGASSSKVNSCHQGLQRLVDSVNADFTVQDLRLFELGITDATDENLHACCDEVRSRLKKVSIHISKKHLYLLGPEQLCSQVAATLREVFSGDLAQVSKQQDSSFLSSSNSNSPPEITEDQSTHLHSNPQVMPETGTGSRQETNHRSDRGTETVNGSVSQPLARKDPVIKEKVKIVGTVEMDGEKTDAFVNHSDTGNDKSARHVNGVGSATTRARSVRDMGLRTKERTMHLTEKDSVQQRQMKIQDTPDQSRSDLAGPWCICVCGESEKLMTRTKCGATLCATCLETVHIHCRVCHETELKPQGIQGEMSTSKLRISLSGHKTDSAIKITYVIPNGIQDEGHPAPGKPFEGGVFEAYLPDCEKTSELLPRLEEAFRRKLTFTVVEKETGGKVTWDGIPHKTCLQGGKTGNGYPDSTYLTRLSEVLTFYGI